MFKRTFTLSLLATIIGRLSLSAQALTIDDYEPSIIKKAQASGQSYALAFHADWFGFV
jgi:hypothetical protein